MFIFSIQDPEIFSAKNITSDKYYPQILSDHLKRLSNNHIIIVDNSNGSSLVIKEIRKHLSDWDSTKYNTLFRELNAVLNLQNIVRLKPLDSRIDKLKSILDKEASVICIGLASHQHDIIVLDEETMAALELSEVDKSTATTLINYRNCKTANIESQYTSAKHIGGMDCNVFLIHYLKPLLIWAQTVKIVDKYINKAAQDNSSNWNNFKETIKLIYNTWRNGYGYKSTNLKYRFEIISSRDTYTGENEALALAEKLGLPQEEQLRIRLKPKDKIIREDFHDRYIQTNQITVGFTKGFDLSKLNEMCSPCDVYRLTKLNPTLEKLISSRDSGQCEW